MKKNLLFAALLFSLVLAAGAVQPIRIVPGKQQYTFTPLQSGNYAISAVSESLIPPGKQHMAQLRLGDGLLLSRRLLAYNRIQSSELLARVALSAGKEYTLFFQYDEKTTRVSELLITPETPYPVPQAAANYRPALLPQTPHPRVLVNAAYLSRLKENLTEGENLPVWSEVEQKAKNTFVFRTDRDVTYDSELLAAVQAKAFCYLVTEDRNAGREAVELISAYLKSVSFGNGQDICRKVGETIFSASLVYDWCYPLLSVQEKTFLHDRMLFFAAELETAWPPFRQNAAAGHGNEAQFSRDLLALAIALYDEDPEPWKFVAYQMLENWLPLKSFTHASGRHSQGSSYGQFRSQYDFLAALQFQRTFGIRVFPDAAWELPYYWYYLRLPDGLFLIEGDDNWKVTYPQYVPISPLLLNCVLAQNPDPELKMELQRGKKLSKWHEPVLFLLTNDPALKEEDRRSKLPLVRLYRAPLPGMAVRSGWNFSMESDDLVLTVNGGNYHFRNHQHADLGSFQLYYHGLLVSDLGQYKFYGLPYDRYLNKSSALHSLMRFYDPGEARPAREKQYVNSGSEKLLDDRPPRSLAHLKSDKRYYGGETPRMGAVPSEQKAVCSFLETDLAPAFAGRVKRYTRSFVCWNQNEVLRPGFLLILDRFETEKPAVQPIFQLTTIAEIVKENGNLTLHSVQGKKKGRLSVRTLLPAKHSIDIFSGDASRTFEGICIPARMPERREAQGSRIELTGPGNVFLNALQVCDETQKPFPVRCQQHDGRIEVLLSASKGDYLTSFGEVKQLCSEPFRFSVPKDNTQVLLLDLAPGNWELSQGKQKITETVSADRGSFFAVLPHGEWTITPTGGRK